MKILRDFKIIINDYNFDLRKGDKLPDNFPKLLIQNLITEKVIARQINKNTDKKGDK